LLEQVCIQSGGHLDIEKARSNGLSKLTAVMQYSHADRPAMGDIVSAVQSLIVSNPQVNILYMHRYNGREFSFATEYVNARLDGVPFDTPSVAQWIKETIAEGLTEIYQDSGLPAGGDGGKQHV